MYKTEYELLNEKTKNLNNLNQLGIYLAKQTNLDALKTLKLIICSSANNLLDKDFDINATRKIITRYDICADKRDESVIGNLSINPQNYALELMDLVIRNFKVDLGAKAYGVIPYELDTGNSLFYYWIKSFKNIEGTADLFYKRYDRSKTRYG